MVSKHQPGDQYLDTHRSVSLRGGGGSGGGGAAEWEVGARHGVNTGGELGESGDAGQDQEAREAECGEHGDTVTRLEENKNLRDVSLFNNSNHQSSKLFI